MDVVESTGVTGQVVITLIGPDGETKSQQTVKNLVTDTGDQYNAQRIAAAVVPAAPADVGSKVTGIKLGTGTTAVAKSGAGAALVAYVTGGRAAFDAGFPTTQSLGAGLGWTITYQVTFPPGVGTATALTEAAMVIDQAADATSTAGNTTARCVFAAQPKSASDTLILSWAHKQNGN